MNWKTTAIIFIVVSILEFSIIGLIAYYTFAFMGREDSCVNICFTDTNASYYNYDESYKICSCYDSDYEIIKSWRIKK